MLGYITQYYVSTLTYIVFFVWTCTRLKNIKCFTNARRFTLHCSLEFFPSE